MSGDALARAERRGDCPYCGEALDLLLDPGDAGVDYIEDCQVCCRPMVVSPWQDAHGELHVSLRREDD